MIHSRDSARGARPRPHALAERHRLRSLARACSITACATLNGAWRNPRPSCSCAGSVSRSRPLEQGGQHREKHRGVRLCGGLIECDPDAGITTSVNSSSERCSNQQDRRAASGFERSDVFPPCGIRAVERDAACMAEYDGFSTRRLVPCQTNRWWFPRSHRGQLARLRVRPVTANPQSPRA